MTTRTVFELDLGTKQGRMPNPRSAGSFTVELGHADRIVEEFENHSANEVSQEITVVPGTKLLRARVHIKAPGAPVAEPGYAAWQIKYWLFSVSLDHVMFYERALGLDAREMVLNDIAVAMLAAEDSTHTLTFRLQFGWFEGG